MHVSGDGYQKLADAIERGSYETITIFPKTKDELVNTYKQLYPKSWQKHLSEDLVIQRGIKRDDPKFGKEAHKAARNYNPDRISSKPLKKNREEIEKLGRTHAKEVTVPKKIAGKKAKVTFNGEVCIPSSGGKKKNDCRDRNFTRTLDTKQAHDMRQAPDEETGKGPFDPIFDAYDLEPDIIGSISVYDISVDFL